MGTHLSNCQATWRLVEGPEKQRWMFIIRVRDDTVFFFRLSEGFVWKTSNFTWRGGYFVYY